jgi:phosphatidylserine synthase
MTRAMQITAWCGVPALWAFNMQFGQIAPYADCVAQRSWSGLVTSAILCVAVAVVLVSSIKLRRMAGIDRFLLLSGCLITSIFSFAVMLQGLASLVIDPCAR